MSASAQMAESNRQIAESNRRIDALQLEAAQRFTRIETILLEHSQILADHTRILEALSDAIRDKIGFKMPDRPVS